MDVIEPFMTLDQIIEQGKYPEDFVEEFAPRRFFRLKRELTELKRRVIVVYGLRRLGKTYALIKLGEESESEGFEFMYYEAVYEDEHFDPSVSGRIGKRLMDAIQSGLKPFIVIDEAFNLPLKSLENFLQPLANVIDKPYMVILSGSYTYDLKKLYAEVLLRYFKKQARFFELTLPRIPTLNISSVLEDSISEPYDSIPNIFFLEKIGLVKGGKISPKINSLFNLYETTAGLPRVLTGKQPLEDEVETIAELMKSSIYIDPKSKISKKIKDRPSFENIISEIENIISKGSGDKATIHLSKRTHILALSSSLITPRRYIKADSREDLNNELRKIMKRMKRDSSLYARPIPSTLASYYILEEYLVEMPYSGIINETYIAHTLTQTLLRKLSTRGVATDDSDLHDELHRLPIRAGLLRR